MIERLTGIIPAEDDRYLQQLIDTEEEVRALWKAFQEETRESGARFYIERLDVKEELAVLRERLPEQPFRVPEWVIAIGIILALGILSYFFPMRAEQSNSPAQDTISVKK